MSSQTKRVAMQPVAILLSPFTAAALLVTVLAATAGETSWPPKPARGKGNNCVAETEWMRRNHMTVLMHQRDDTVHDGIRAKRFSLKGCIECHAVQSSDGRPVAAASAQHFCRSCHDYAAVRVDCFECHASRPEGQAATSSGVPDDSADAEAATLAQYLRELTR